MIDIQQPWIGFARLLLIALFALSVFTANTLAAQTPEESQGESPVESSAETSNGESTNDGSRQPRIELLEDFQDAIGIAQIEQRPLLVVFGADWCSWCRKLEGELTSQEADTILRTWVVVKVDTDAEPEIAERMSVRALPGLRILSADQQPVASREGYLPLKDLQLWLDEHSAAADPSIRRVLYETTAIDSEALKELIQFLADRDPKIRGAAKERLQQAKGIAASAIVDTLRSGSLSQRLCSVDLLVAWQAPVTAIDPWRPETINEATTAPLITWLQTVGNAEDGDSDSEAADSGTSESGVDTPTNPEAIQAAISELMKATPENQAAKIANALFYDRAVLPNVRQFLQTADSLSDEQRLRLRELQYLVLAGRQSRLENASLFTPMASLNAEVHREAAIRFLKGASSRDQDLVDELSQDTDPLIRESAVASLKTIGALYDEARFQRLLNDNSPSVRTAVLRELAADPEDSLVKSLVQYLEKETDEDLLVYATKTLGEIRRSSGEEEALANLATNPSWRVRAAAIDAFSSRLDSSSANVYNSETNSFETVTNVTPVVAEAILTASADSDPFVAEKANLLVPKIISKETAESVANYLLKNPSRLDQFDLDVDSRSLSGQFSHLVDFVKPWTEQDDKEKLKLAVRITGKFAPVKLQSMLDGLLASEDGEIRLAALQSVLPSMSVLRKASIMKHQAQWLIQNPFVPLSREQYPAWHPVPEWYEPLKATAKQSNLFADQSDDDPFGNTIEMETVPVETASSLLGLLDKWFAGAETTVEPVVEPAVENPELDAFDSFFGEPTTDASTNETAETTAEIIADSSEKESELDIALQLFGEAPQEPKQEEQTAETNSVSSKGSLAQDDAETTDDAPVGQQTGLPSEWYAEWLRRENFTADERWVATVRQALADKKPQLLDAPQEDQRSKELYWLEAAQLATGKFEASDATALADSLLQSDHATKVAILTWLPPTEILRLLQADIVQWPQFTTAESSQLLLAATTLDNLEIAELVFQRLSQLPLDKPEDLTVAREVLLNSLVGWRGSPISSYLHLDQRAKQATTFFDTDDVHYPGRERAVQWLSEHYATATRPEVRALLFMALTSLDHRLATETAFGYLASIVDMPEESGPLVTAATKVTFADMASLSIDRACQLLHSKNEVTLLAIAERMFSSGAEYTQENYSPNLVLIYDYEDRGPGLFSIQRAISDEIIRSLQEHPTARIALLGRLLAVAAGDTTIPLATITDEELSSAEMLATTAALAKAQRTDEEAIQFYRQQADNLLKADDISSARVMYLMIRDLSGDEVAAVRSAMREAFGGQLLQSY